MSPFLALVATEEKPTTETLNSLLAPYHKFEATGLDDKYVQEIDITEEAFEQFSLEAEGGENFPSWATRRYNCETINLENQCKIGDSSYGRVEINSKGAVAKIIRRTNPNAKWDWWVVGGRWSGFLLPKANMLTLDLSDKNYPERGEPGVMGSQANPHGIDIIRKGDVDFEYMRMGAGIKAGQQWDKVREIVGESIKWFIPWKRVRDKLFEGDTDAARKFYNDQVSLIKLKFAATKLFKETEEKFLTFASLEDYLSSRKVHVQRARNAATSAFALIKDNEWIERKNMGANGTTQEQWDAYFNAMLDDLPEDYWLTVLDYHI